jgi:hypothetical protein
VIESTAAKVRKDQGIQQHLKTPLTDVTNIGVCGGKQFRLSSCTNEYSSYLTMTHVEQKEEEEERLYEGRSRTKHLYDMDGY